MSTARNLRPRGPTGRAQTAAAASRRRARQNDLEDDDEVVLDEEIFDADKSKHKDKEEEEADSIMVEEEEVIENDEDEDDVWVAQRKRQAVETTLANVKAATKTNTTYLQALIFAEKYLRKAGPGNEKRLTITREKILDTLRALEDLPLPITKTEDPIAAKPSAPEIPAADGSEIRFTAVARDLGIVWSTVPEQQKLRLYERAAQYHKDEFGVWPKRVNMWTSSGVRPVYYYNAETYRSTMMRALQEFKDQ
jgi:hypothetical protein